MVYFTSGTKQGHDKQSEQLFRMLARNPPRGVFRAADIVFTEIVSAKTKQILVLPSLPTELTQILEASSQ